MPLEPDVLQPSSPLPESSEGVPLELDDEPVGAGLVETPLSTPLDPLELDELVDPLDELDEVDPASGSGAEVQVAPMQMSAHEK